MNLAVALDEAVRRRISSGEPGDRTSRVLARGDGWAASDVVCTAGPRDRVFGEQHRAVQIAVVVAGTFQYRSSAGRGVMTPGALMLGAPGQGYECGHEHGAGDRCIAFSYRPEHFAALAEGAGAGEHGLFRAARVPPVRGLAPVVASAAAGALGLPAASWEEIATSLAGDAAHAAAGTLPVGEPAAGPLARVSRVLRRLEREPARPSDLIRLAAEARLSPYHFLRTFRHVTGVTPHQYVLRLRLRAAALRLLAGSEAVIDVALDAGFGDVSNFNHAFRTEFGVPPSAFRRRAGMPIADPSLTRR